MFRGRFLPLLILLALIASACSGGGSASTSSSSSSASTLGQGSTTLSGLVGADPGDPSSNNQVGGATVYIIGQEDKAVYTGSDGSFSLTVSTQLSNLILAGLRPATAPQTKQYGLVVISSEETHGRKTEVLITEDEDNTAPGLTIAKVGSITGTAYLEGKTDHSGITVYIPGTSFSAITDSNGDYTISRVPPGTYDFLRAEKFGTVYHYAMSSNVTVASNSEVVVPDMTLMLSVGPFGKVTINGGTDFTTSSTVELQIAAKQNAVLMQISNEPFFFDTNWEPVQAYKQYAFTDDFSQGGKSVTAYIHFAEESGLMSAPTSDSIYIDPNPLSAKVSPVSVTKDTTPTLDWSYSAPMPFPKYRMQFANNSGFSPALVDSTNMTASAYTYLTPLAEDTYYWRVAIIENSTGIEWNWAGPWSFDVDLSAVNLDQPSNGAVTADTTPTLSWLSDASASTFTLTHSANSDLSGGTDYVVSAPLVSKTLPALAGTASTPYFWSVTAYDAEGNAGRQSDIWTYTLDTIAPTGSMNIDGDYPLTASRDVRLTLSASDVNSVSAYYASESIAVPQASDFITLSPIVTNYSGEKEFNVSAGSGVKTVYLWYKDRAGNVSSRYEDSVRLLLFNKSTAVSEGNNVDTTLSLDASGKAHITFTSGDFSIKYTTNAGGSWNTAAITTGYDPVSFLQNGSMHMTYFYCANNDCMGTPVVVYYSTNAGGSFVSTAISNATRSLSSESRAPIAVDSGGNAHILFVSDYADNYKVKYATNAGGGGFMNTVIGAFGIGYGAVGLSLDSNSKAHICYIDYDAGWNLNNLYYATNAGGGGFTNTVVGDGMNYFCNIAVDSNFKAHILYLDSASNLLYINNVSGSWSSPALIDALGYNLDYRVSISIDTSGHVHISYPHPLERTLKYATNAYGSWGHVTVHDATPTFTVGRESSIALDANGKVHISYKGELGVLGYAVSQ